MAAADAAAFRDVGDERQNRPPPEPNSALLAAIVFNICDCGIEPIEDNAAMCRDDVRRAVETIPGDVWYANVIPSIQANVAAAKRAGAFIVKSLRTA